MNPLEQVLSALRAARAYVAGQGVPRADDDAASQAWDPRCARMTGFLQRNEARLELLQHIDLAITGIESQLGCGLSCIPQRALRLVVTVEADGHAAAAEAMRSAVSVVETTESLAGGSVTGPGYNFAIQAVPERPHAM